MNNISREEYEKRRQLVAAMAARRAVWERWEAALSIAEKQQAADDYYEASVAVEALSVGGAGVG
jgi:hypothetical protein